jgi:hypothetical protein
VAVAGLDQDPAVACGAGQGESAGELAAVQLRGQVAGLVAGDLGRALVPDDDRARAAGLPGPGSLEVTRGQRVVLDRHGQPPDTGVE